MARQHQSQPDEEERARSPVPVGATAEAPHQPSEHAAVEDIERLDALVRELSAENARLARLAAFPEQNPNPAVEADFDGRIRYANPSG